MPKAAIESPAESMTEQAMMPRFVDGSINLGELTIRLTEDVLNAIIIPEADQLCVGSANSATAIASTTWRHVRATITLQIPKLRISSFFFPLGHRQALTARQSGSSGNGG